MEGLQSLHASIQYFEAIGAWGMAEALRQILIKRIKESKNGSN